jgi:hypothetical protein
MSFEPWLHDRLERWGLELGDPVKTIWFIVQSHEDGCMTMVALERVADEPGDPSFRIYRASAIGGISTINVAAEITGEGLVHVDDYQFRKGRGSHPWAEAIKQSLSATADAADVTVVWANVDGDDMAFVARVNGNGAANLICGHGKGSNEGVRVVIDVNVPLAFVLDPEFPGLRSSREQIH